MLVNRLETSTFSPSWRSSPRGPRRVGRRSCRCGWASGDSINRVAGKHGISAKRRPFIVATVGIQSWGKAKSDIPPSEGIAPSEAGKAAEVGVVGMNLGLVLHGYGGYVRVGHQVRADAGRDEISPEVDQVAGPGVDRDDVGEREPLPDAVHRFRGAGN